MKKLCGEAATLHARATGQQLYYQDAAVSLQVATEQLQENPAAVSCERLEEVAFCDRLVSRRLRAILACAAVRQASEVLVLAVQVGSLDMLDVRRMELQLLPRQQVREDPEGHQVLHDLDLAERSGRVPIWVFIHDGRIRKGLAVGASPAEVARG